MSKHKKIDSLVVFAFNINDITGLTNIRHGRLRFDNIEGCNIEFLGEFPSDFANSSFTLYGQTADKKSFTATHCFTSQVISPLHSKHKIFINKLLLGACLENIEELCVTNISVRTSYLEHWFNFLPLEWNVDWKIYSMDTEQLKIDNRIKYSDDFTLSFSHEYKSNTEKNKRFSFDMKRLIEISSDVEVSIELFEKEYFKVLNLFKFLLPSKNVYIEECFFTYEEKKIEIFRKQGFYQQEDDDTSWTNYIARFNTETIEALIKNWFKTYDKYNLIFDNLYSIFNEQTTPLVETQFLFQMQWLEGFCREKFPTPQSDIDKYNLKIENIKGKFEPNTEEYKCIEEYTKYGYEASLPAQLKKLFNDIKLNNYIVMNSKDRKSIVGKITNLRNGLTHPKSTIKSYTLQELSYINDFLKGLIVLSILSELTLEANEGDFTINPVLYQFKFAWNNVLKK